MLPELYMQNLLKNRTRFRKKKNTPFSLNKSMQALLVDGSSKGARFSLLSYPEELDFDCPISHQLTITSHAAMRNEALLFISGVNNKGYKF